MTYNELIAGFKKAGFKPIKYGAVKENGRNYDLYKIKIAGGKKTLLITSGFHGEEFNGPVSLLKNIKKISAYAQKRKVNLIIYPCVNPSGFDRRQRYNASGEAQNNFVMLYKLAGGQTVDTLRPGHKVVGVKHRQSDAKEVRALQADLRRLGMFKKLPTAVLDIHQDDDLPNGDFYAYVYDRRAIYEKIMKAAERFGRRARRVTAFNFENGVKIRYYIDVRGFIALHDCSLPDLFWNLGTPYAAAVETKAQAPLQQVAAVNLTWIKGMIDLVSGA